MRHDLFCTFVFVVTAASLLSGCIGIRHDYVVVPLDGYLYAPEDKYKFKKGNSRFSSRFTEVVHSAEIRLYAEDSSVLVILSPLGGRDFLRIISLTGTEEIHVDYNNTFYQINNGGEKKMPLPGETSARTSGLYNSRIRVDSTVAYNKYYELDSLSEELKFSDIQRYKIPFRVNKKEYLIDVSLKYRRSFSPEFYAPGLSSP